MPTTKFGAIDINSNALPIGYRSSFLLWALSFHAKEIGACRTAVCSLLTFQARWSGRFGLVLWSWTAQSSWIKIRESWACHAQVEHPRKLVGFVQISDSSRNGTIASVAVLIDRNVLDSPMQPISCWSCQWNAVLNVTSNVGYDTSIWHLPAMVAFSQQN